jgi:hypothetical protein
MMPTSASLDDWASPLAALAASLHHLTKPAQEWDVPGVRAAISKSRHRGTPNEVTRALLKLAAKPDLRTPAMLAEDGAHWGTATVIPAATQARCPLPGHEHELASNCRSCAGDAKAGDPTPADPPTISADQAARNIAWAERVRAEYVRPAWLDEQTTSEGEK